MWLSLSVADTKQKVTHFIPATDEDNRMIVEMFDLAICLEHLLGSGVHHVVYLST